MILLVSNQAGVNPQSRLVTLEAGNTRGAPFPGWARSSDREVLLR